MAEALITLFTGDNPYGYLAHLFDAQTEGHTDSTDWEGALAALTCFGDFTGKSWGSSLLIYLLINSAGGNFVVPELDLNIPFPSGSNCHLRGREIYHYVTGYEGHRHCIVLTNKESVRKTLPDFEKAYQERMKTVAELQMKDEEEPSKEEKDFLKNFPGANKEGKRAVQQLLWQLARAQRHASKKPEKAEPAKGNGQRSKSEEDNSDQPAPKKQKMSESG